MGGTRPAVGQPAPKFKLPDAEGRLTGLEDFAGKNVLLLFLRFFG